MKTINEVIIAVQEQQPCSEQELRLTLLALEYMRSHLDRQMHALVEKVIAEDWRGAKFKAEFEKLEHEHRFSDMKVTAEHYLGPGLTPGTPDNIRAINSGKALFKKATGLDIDDPRTFVEQQPK